MIDPGAGPEAFETPIDNRARNLQIFTPGDNRLIQRLALPLSASVKWMRNILARNCSFMAYPLSVVYLRRTMGILDDVYVRQNDQPLRDHLVYEGQEGVQFLFRSTTESMIELSCER